MEALINKKDPQLARRMQSLSITCKIALQWIPSHCGLAGNEEVYQLVKLGAQSKQPTTPDKAMSVVYKTESVQRDITKQNEESKPECQRCIREFNRRSYLTRHLKIVHKLNSHEASSKAIFGLMEVDSNQREARYYEVISSDEVSQDKEVVQNVKDDDSSSDDSDSSSSDESYEDISSDEVSQDKEVVQNVKDDDSSSDDNDSSSSDDSDSSSDECNSSDDDEIKIDERSEAIHQDKRELGRDELELADEENNSKIDDEVVEEKEMTERKGEEEKYERVTENGSEEIEIEIREDEFDVLYDNFYSRDSDNEEDKNDGNDGTLNDK
ncbi:germ cell nuclear acidic protein-like [Mercenaria mercenaria]|uniref:germ cell nuclear acidic protein-like n=1 Tax=Mercenaria mercenaria TaxID=6596 RepID=UPI00234F8DF6|nr:germ cell nuclear acidic protein-like [Mercenaria mercenaria]